MRWISSDTPRNWVSMYVFITPPIVILTMHFPKAVSLNKMEIMQPTVMSEFFILVMLRCTTEIHNLIGRGIDWICTLGVRDPERKK